MRKLLKVLLPPFTGFLLFFAGVRYSSVYFDLKIDEIGMGNLKSFMAFYRYALPLLFMVALLTQLLIVMPVWRKLVKTTLANRINIIIDICFVCVVLAFGISYTIWEPETGVNKLVKLTAFMSGVQVIYWSINLWILYLLE
ncbi:MAG TPA: hypothetical protein VHA56_07465 [Mucilaginibacter sp.]|nr:hypothetical protein [Mucilaginibacter sp.]